MKKLLTGIAAFAVIHCALLIASSSAVAGRGAIGKEAIELTTATTDRPRPIARVIGRSRPTSAVILESSSESRRVRMLVATMAIATAIRGDAISRGEAMSRLRIACACMGRDRRARV